MAARKRMNHDIYLEAVEKHASLRLPNTRIGAKRHVITTSTTQKICLSPFDDKKYIMRDGVNTLPLGHHSLDDELSSKEIAFDDDWGLPEEDESGSIDGETDNTELFYEDFMPLTRVSINNKSLTLMWRGNSLTLMNGG